MLELIDQILAADSYTWSIAIVLMLCAATVVHSMTESMAFTALFSPVLLAGALTGAWIFRHLSLLGEINRDILVIIATSAGMILTLVPLLGLTRFVTILRDVIVRPPRHEVLAIRASRMKKSIPVDHTT